MVGLPGEGAALVFEEGEEGIGGGSVSCVAAVVWSTEGSKEIDVVSIDGRATGC